MIYSYDTQPVTDYALPNEKIEALLAYPGPRPEGAFLTDGEKVTMLPSTFAEFRESADTLLAMTGLPLIADRIPVLAYGANASPHKLAEKMAKFDDDQTVPHCVVELPDTAAVWHGQPGQIGSYFAELYRGPDAKGITLQTHVAFLTLEQMGAIDSTEGVTYTKFLTPAKLGLGENDPTTDVVAYVALDSQILQKDQKPVLVEQLNHRNTVLTRMTARKALEFTLEAVADEVGVPAIPEDYITEGTTLKLADKKARQARMKAPMLKLGMSLPYSAVADEPEKVIPRLDFASIGNDHELHMIPQMVWSDSEKVRLNVQRARIELSNRTGLQVIENKT